MYSMSEPWIKEREATLCTWKFDYNRGYISNMSTSLINDFMSLSNRQVRNYAEMIKACGFTGIQVMDMCTAWRASGSWETVHDKFKVLANACHEIGLKFTVWCWAAEFSGHGWTDPDAVYRNADPSKPACEDPRVLSVFNRYYDIYADLAPYADRVIAHFFDPGNLTDMESIVYFVKLLASKFREKKPDVKIAVDTWGSPDYYPQALVDAGMKDVMLMELPFLPVWRQPGKRAAFREGVKKLGCGLGSWGWYTSDIEIDQLPYMTVNCRVVKDVFNKTREQADHVMVPQYWSEIDSYHILNYFSLYAAGHLLADPDDDPDRLLRESVCAITGDNKENEDRLTSIVELIRDARSGDSWDSYWWSEPGYILKNYDHTKILNRAGEAIKALEALISEPEPDDGIPFPITRRQLYKLILPHLYQIRQYAQFDRDFSELTEMKHAGAGKDELQKKVDSLNCNVPEYNCVIGLWGQREASTAFDRTGAFCRENGLTAPDRSPSVRYIHKRRFVDHLIVDQRYHRERLWVHTSFYEADLIGAEYSRSLMDELAAEKVLEKDDEGRYSLANWQDYSFDFSF